MVPSMRQAAFSGFAILLAALVGLTVFTADARAQEADAVKLLQDFNTHYNSGRYAEAAKLAEQGLAAAERAHGPKSKAIVSHLNNFGLSLRELGRYAEAEPLLQRAVVLNREAGNADPEAHLPLLNLAGLYWLRSRFAEAEPMYLQAIEISVKALGPEHPSVALCLNNLGLLYWTQGRLAEAEPRFKQAISNLDRAGGTDPVLALALTNLSNVYQVQGRIADAEPLLRRSIALTSAQAGAEHPDVAIALNNLGELLRVQGRTSEAEASYRQSLAISEKAFGRRHGNVAIVLNNIAEIYRTSGRFAEAEPLYAESLEIRLAVLGPAHLAIAQSLNNQALNQAALGRTAEAEALLKRSLAITTQNVGSEHLDVANALHNLALLATLDKRFDEAEAHFQRSLAIRKKNLEASHPAVLQSETGIAFLREAQGRKDEAETLRKRIAQAPNWEVIEIPVLFASNRVHVMTDKGPQFGSDQLLDPRRIAMGRALLRAPKAEVINRAERNAAALGRLQNATGRQTSESALSVHSVALFDDGAASFWPDARATLARASRFPKQAMVFVHGYNNSFEDAVRRASMISFDLEFDGIVAAFAWPARSGMTAYMGDRERAQTAAPFLLALLETLGKALPETKVHIVSHSTGSEVVLTALDKLADKTTSAPAVRIGEVIFAHADVNTSRLEQVLPGLRRLGVRVTSYSSREDLAMRASDLIRMDGKRVGGAPVYLSDVDAIDISGLGSRFSLNHTVFVQNPQVFNDMARLMATSVRPPHARSPQFVAVTTGAGTHWEYRAALPVTAAKK